MDKKVEHEYTQEIVCPFCGTIYGDCWELCPDEKLVEIDCDECGEMFFARADYDVTYVTSKPTKKP
jgi:predicted RNA-binding Zn-ribbon protein involved in translation (DUF1610 family)